LVLNEERHALVDLARLDEVVVVEYQQQVGRQAVRSLSRAETTASGAVWADCSRPRAAPPRPGAAVCRAVTTYVQNVAGSLSLVSSDNQATGVPSEGAAASQFASMVVLPNPAGADISVTA
jgi:hypothetical protein